MTDAVVQTELERNEQLEYEAILADIHAKEDDYADSYGVLFRMKEVAS